MHPSRSRLNRKRFYEETVAIRPGKETIRVSRGKVGRSGVSGGAKTYGEDDEGGEMHGGICGWESEVKSS